MPENRTFIAFHEALMQLSHSQEFNGQQRDQKLGALARMCGTLLNVDRVSVWKFDRGGNRLVNESLFDLSEPEILCGKSEAVIEQDQHPRYFEALATARIIHAVDAKNDAVTRSFLHDYLEPENIVSMLAAPIFDCGYLGGVVCVEAHQHRHWRLPELAFVAAIADTISLMDAHEAWIRSKQKLEYITHYDSLTGLANLQTFQDRMSYLIHKIERRAFGQFAIIWLDLDRLKVINDGLGSRFGDAVIAETAQRLQDTTVPGKDMLARTGGDEFALIIRDHTRPEVLESVTQRILEDMRTPFRIGEHSLSVTASLGICEFPGDGVGAESLLRNAEAAMYQAKTRGPGQASRFDNSIQITARSRFALERELREAIRNNQLDVFYQPIVEAVSLKVVCAEALVRWQHPDRGLLAPIEFLGVARSASLMYDLGESVLRRVCRDRQEATERQLSLPVMTLNLASEQVMNPDLPRLVKAVCKEFGVPQRELHFEVTEDAIQGDSSALKATLEKLVRAGSELAIDDFGTGYSSLSRLKHLPFSKLKIDRSFISDIPDDEDDCAITLSIIGLARGLGLSLVAEGVETQGHEQWLNAQGCEYLQGDRYSKPVPFESLLKVLA